MAIVETGHNIDGQYITYEIQKDGYTIYIGGNVWFDMREPNLIRPELTYEEQAIRHIGELVGESTTQAAILERLADLENALCELSEEVGANA